MLPKTRLELLLSLTCCDRATYSKVLGKRELLKQPVIVKAKFLGRIAEEKIKGLGGDLCLGSLKPHEGKVIKWSQVLKK